MEQSIVSKAADMSIRENKEMRLTSSAVNSFRKGSFSAMAYPLVQTKGNRTDYFSDDAGIVEGGQSFR